MSQGQKILRPWNEKHSVSGMESFQPLGEKKISYSILIIRCFISIYKPLKLFVHSLISSEAQTINNYSIDRSIQYEAVSFILRTDHFDDFNPSIEYSKDHEF